jgi:hypothetical protein
MTPTLPNVSANICKNTPEIYVRIMLNTYDCYYSLEAFFKPKELNEGR